jgi:hypothetical protein
MTDFTQQMCQLSTFPHYGDIEMGKIYGPNYKVYNPSRSEIRKACLEIQSKWTDQEREGRFYLSPGELYEAEYYTPRPYEFPQAAIPIPS